MFPFTCARGGRRARVAGAGARMGAAGGSADGAAGDEVAVALWLL